MVKPERLHVFDSGKQIELPEHRIFAVTYEPLWQMVRANCGFRNVDEAHSSLAKLEAYIGQAEGQEQSALRLYRAGNLLNALPIGQTAKSGIHLISLTVEDLVLPYRSDIAKRVVLIGRPSEWDWHTSRKQLRNLWKSEPKNLEAAYADLRKRAVRRDPKLELRYYMSMMEEVADEFKDENS
jgi:hypothetical protein